MAMRSTWRLLVFTLIWLVANRIQAEQELPPHYAYDYGYTADYVDGDEVTQEGIHQLLDKLDGYLDAWNNSMLNHWHQFMSNDWNDMVLDDVMQNVIQNAENLLEHLGTNLEEVWEEVVKDPAEPSASETTNNATQHDIAKLGQQWIAAAVEKARRASAQQTNATSDQQDHLEDPEYSQALLFIQSVLHVLTSGDAVNKIGTADKSSSGSGTSNDSSTKPRYVNTSNTGVLGSPATRRTRKLQQGGQGALGVGPGGGRAIANAFRLVFGNFLDLLNGGGRYYATILTNLAAILLNNNFPREGSFYPEAFINDLIDTNIVPVPSSNAAALALLLAVLQGYCNLQAVTASSIILGSITAPTLTITLSPATCPVRENTDTGLRSVIWEECEPAQLIISKTPWLFNAPYVTGATYTAGSCRYEYYLGTDTTFTLGGGNVGSILRRSTRGFTIIPLVNQINLIARFAPYIFPPASEAAPLFGTPQITQLVGQSTTGLGTGGAAPPAGIGAAGGIPPGGGVTGLGGFGATARSSESNTQTNTPGASGSGAGGRASIVDGGIDSTSATGSGSADDVTVNTGVSDRDVKKRDTVALSQEVQTWDPNQAAAELHAVSDSIPAASSTQGTSSQQGRSGRIQGRGAVGQAMLPAEPVQDLLGSPGMVSYTDLIKKLINSPTQ